MNLYFNLNNKDFHHLIIQVYPGIGGACKRTAADIYNSTRLRKRRVSSTSNFKNPNPSSNPSPNLSR